MQILDPYSDRLNQFLLESEDVNSQTGLSPAELEKLKEREEKVSLTEMLTEQTCPVCFEDYKAGENIISLPKCRHCFHSGCVNEWLAKIPLCPMCRGNVRNGLVDGQQPREDVENPANQ